MIKEANKKPAKPETKVAAVVAVPVKPEPQRLPEIPTTLRKCLEAKAAKADATATADDTVKALYAADRTKADCARKLFAWYRDRQPKQTAAVTPDGHPRTERKAPAATW